MQNGFPRDCLQADVLDSFADIRNLHCTLEEVDSLATMLQQKLIFRADLFRVVQHIPVLTTDTLFSWNLSQRLKNVACWNGVPWTAAIDVICIILVMTPLSHRLNDMQRRLSGHNQKEERDKRWLE